MTEDDVLYSKDGKVLLFVGERKKPKNCPEMRTARDMFEDSENLSRRSTVNRVSRVVAEKEWQSGDNSL